VNTPNKIKQIRLIVIITGIFTVFIGLLLLINYIQIRTSKPLDSTIITTLMGRLALESNNELLISEIRHMDLLARKAYFTSLWQIKTGSYLMLFGAIAFIVSLRTYFKLRFLINKPFEEEISERTKRELNERWIGIAGISIVLLGGISAFFTVNSLKDYNLAQSLTSFESVSSIPVIELHSADENNVLLDTIINSNLIDIIDVENILTEDMIWQNYNAFRGPWGNGISKHTNIPTDWNGASGKNILWKTAIPIHGYNSPIVWGDKIFISGANLDKRIVYCINRLNGKILWQKEANNISGSPEKPPKTTDDTGLAASTLTADNLRVYAIFGTGDIIAFDHDGNRIWARNLGVPANHYGHSSSLLIWDSKVFVQYDTQKGSKVMALNSATGETTWETSRTDDISWASPILAKINNKFQLILLANPNLSGYDISNGKLLWAVNCMWGEVGTSPVYGGGLVYAGAEYANMVAVNPVNGQKVWEDNHYLPEVSSPIYYNQHLYIATTFSVIACFDAKKGEFIWEYDAKNTFYSSPVIADGKLYVFDTEGKAYIFNPGNEPKIINSPELGEKVYASPAFADGRIYVRGNKHLYCIGSK